MENKEKENNKIVLEIHHYHHNNSSKSKADKRWELQILLLNALLGLLIAYVAWRIGMTQGVNVWLQEHGL